MEGGYNGLKNLLPEGRSMEELERELQEEKIRGEIITLRIMKRRMLEEEEERSFELKHKMSRNPTEYHQSSSSLPVSSMCANVAQRMSSSPITEEIKEIPIEISIPVKNSACVKRRYNTTFAETCEVKHQNIIKEWGCALCHVSAPSEDEFNDHLKGQEHLANVLKLGHGSRKATENGNCDKTLNDKSGIVQEKKEDKAANNTQEGMDNKGPDGGELNCNLCGVRVSSKHTLSEHLKGKKHLAKVMKFSPSTKSATENSNGNDSSLNGKAINIPESEVVANLVNRDIHDAVKEKLFYCMLCNVNCSGKGAMDSHLMGKKHLAMAQKMSLAPVTEEIEKSPNEVNLPEQNAAYDKTNTSPPFAETHGVDLLKAINNCFSCTLCNVSVTSEFALKEHQHGKKHLANVMKQSSISQKERENSTSNNNSSSNVKAINTPESHENVETKEIHDAAKEEFSAADYAPSNV